MLECKTKNDWKEFLSFMEKRLSTTEFENWFSHIEVLEETDSHLNLSVPNIFVREYLLDNYREELCNFFPKDHSKDPAITFNISEPKAPPKTTKKIEVKQPQKAPSDLCLNSLYTFENFIEGPSNQFVKSASIGVANRPGKSFNPLFIHGGVGLGKTHLMHAIGHYVKVHHKKLRIQCITTEAFINDLVDNLRNKSVDKMKRYYRNLDILLVDDIQFLQNRLNFEEEFCNMFEALINQNKQVVVTSDKPPTQLKLSERMIARMEWGLVANVGIPDLETRVAIIQHKSELKGCTIPQRVAFYIAEHIYNNVRQIEGAINRLCAYCRLMDRNITEEIVAQLLEEMFQTGPEGHVSLDNILKSVASIFEVRISDILGDSRIKDIAKARQVAMYLAKELINESLAKIADSFGGKTHSTLLHAWKKISADLQKNEILRRQIQMIKQNINAAN